MTTDPPPQHSTNTARRPRNAPELLTRTVDGLQRLAFIQAQKATHALNVEPPHAPLLRKAAADSTTFRVRIPTSTGEAA
ncbi:MAG: hypothetical protein K9N47_05665 [Prosthecobacter sp.]|uniref:hypothetical protein n=1 Tax=Prosthecobacter sp. TaxID=1965333 RepID=UPI0025CCD7D1|nr:hypothetical protein [Prosthecobacter sp.]MCF7785588.1 hypothetical protein [Prosthecobacter sp.]